MANEDSFLKATVDRLKANGHKVVTYKENPEAFKHIPNRAPVAFSRLDEDDIVTIPGTEGWLQSNIETTSEDLFFQVECEVERKGFTFKLALHLGTLKKSIFPEEGDYIEGVMRDKSGNRILLNQPYQEDAWALLANRKFKVTKKHTHPRCRIREFKTKEYKLVPQTCYELDEV